LASEGRSSLATSIESNKKKTHCGGGEKEILKNTSVLMAPKLEKKSHGPGNIH